MVNMSVNSLRCIVVLFCGCVLLVTFRMELLPSVRIDITRLPNGNKDPNIESGAFASAHPTSKSEEQTVQQEPQKSEAPKTILVWTKLYDGTNWGLPQERGILTCAQFNITAQCRITYDKQEYKRSDLVAFHGRGSDFSLKLLPNLTKRSPHQRWLYYNSESPPHAGLLANQMQGKRLNHLFNWTMTYMLNSDFPYRFFQVLPGKYPDRYNPVQTGEVAVAVISNCLRQRLNYIYELQKYIQVHIYGACGKYRCPAGEECFYMLEREKKYRFYLSFENSVCKDYATEKFHSHALQHNMLPIVINGANLSDPTIAPPGCCINALDFKSAKDLAQYIKKVASNSTLYNSYFKWQSRYAVRHIETRHLLFCRACQRLYSDSETKVYDDLYSWYGNKENCIPYPSP